MINPVVAHRNEVVPAVGVRPNSAVGITGMIELTDETGVQSRTHAHQAGRHASGFLKVSFR